ncbi:hypothetical protein D3C71_1867500 [compost metagenome]
MHVHLAKVQIRIAEQMKHCALIGEADARLRVSFIAKCKHLASRHHHFNPTGFHQWREGALQHTSYQVIEHGERSPSETTYWTLAAQYDSARCAPLAVH